MQIEVDFFIYLLLVVVTVKCKIQYQLYLHTINPHSATHHFGTTCNVASNVSFCILDREQLQSCRLHVEFPANLLLFSSKRVI